MIKEKKEDEIYKNKNWIIWETNQEVKVDVRD